MPFKFRQALRAPFPVFVFCGFLALSLTACGGSSSSDSGNGNDDDDPRDTTAPTATVEPETELAIREAIHILFDEAIEPDSLELGGTLAALSVDSTWNDDHTELTVSPVHGVWESGVQNLTIEATDMAGNAMETLDASFEIRLVFQNFQVAYGVIGQSDLVTDDENQGAGPHTPDADTLRAPFGVPTIAGDRLWIPDYGNARLLGFDGIPEAPGASATWVVGQLDFVTVTEGSSATAFTGVQQGIEHEDRFYMLEYDNSRIMIFDTVPLTPPAMAAHVVGQPDLDASDTACTASGLNEPETMIIVDGKLIVADGGNNRVLIWNTVPTDSDAAPADIVLGQGTMTNCIANDDNQDGISGDVSARTLSMPSGVWSDGERLVVADGDNSRVLIWNSFPESSFTPADIVIGQGDFTHAQRNDDDQDDVVDATSTARTLNKPYQGVWSNGLQLFVSDSSNNRVLVWDDFPTENFQPADHVLGQMDFAHIAADDDNQDGVPDATSSEHTMQFPVGGVLYRDKLLVLDETNNRVLVFESL